MSEGAENSASHQFLLTTETQLALKPRSIISVGDGFIIAGGDAHNAVALKASMSGQINWQRIVPVGQDDRAFFAQKHLGPEFSGAAVMGDGTIFLCGHMVSRPGTYLPALLSHLDQGGRPISERTIVPAQHNQFGIARLTDCARVGENLAAIGYVEHFVAPTETNAANPKGKQYWAMAVDKDGKTKWELQIPISLKSGAINVGPAVVSKDLILTFGATDNVDTEIVRVSREGAVLAKKYLAGSFVLAKTVDGEGPLQAVGRFRSENHEHSNLSALTFDDSLNISNKTDGDREVVFGVRAVYRLPNTSLALFGFGVRPDGSYFSQARLFDSGLKASEDLALDRERVDDFGSLSAVAPMAVPGDFLTATSAVTKEAVNQAEVNDTSPQHFVRGVAVDFVQLNQH